VFSPLTLGLTVALLMLAIASAAYLTMRRWRERGPSAGYLGLVALLLVAVTYVGATAWDWAAVRFEDAETPPAPEPWRGPLPSPSPMDALQGGPRPSPLVPAPEASDG
jgi:hypothetical protein